jgi:hypothetical protein
MIAAIRYWLWQHNLGSMPVQSRGIAARAYQCYGCEKVFADERMKDIELNVRDEFGAPQKRTEKLCGSCCRRMGF